MCSVACRGRHHQHWFLAASYHALGGATWRSKGVLYHNLVDAMSGTRDPLASGESALRVSESNRYLRLPTSHRFGTPDEYWMALGVEGPPSKSVETRVGNAGRLRRVGKVGGRGEPRASGVNEPSQTDGRCGVQKKSGRILALSQR